MSVVTKNPFALLNDDEEASPVPEPAPVETTPPVPPAPRGNNRGRAAPVNTGSRSGRYPKRGGGPAVQAQDGSSTPNPNESGVTFDRSANKPERGRGRGRGRGGRGRDGDRPERGRPYDKHSQTAIVDTDKKVEQGWGADTGTAELAAETGGEADAQTTTWEDAATTAITDWANATPGADAAAWADPNPTDTSGWGVPADGEAAANADNGKPAHKSRRDDEEEEDNTLTLDEYLAKKKAEDSAVPKLEGGRKIGDADWKDAVPLVKDENDVVYFAGKAKSVPKPRTKKEEKISILIDGHFDRPGRDGGRGRGGRGRGGDRGDRGRGGGGSGRGGRGGRRGESLGNGDSWGNNAKPVDVDDQSAFPSLG